MLRRTLLVSTALLASAAPAGAQKLRDQLGELLTFGGWTVPLRVGTLAPDGRSVLPNDAFLAGSNGSNITLGTFLVNWMTASASSAPVASTGGGRSFRFAGGVPVEAPPSPGPIFGERATTLGRGSVLAGVNYTGVQYSRVRGVPLDALRFTFTQSAASTTAADALALDAALDYDMALTSIYATVGVRDRLDVGVVLPLVQSRLRGVSTARVVAGSGSSTVIGGTAAAPVLTSQQAIGGRASGIGDVAVRAKFNLLDRPAGGLGLLADVRLPTGDARNLLGSGSTAVRALAVYSGRYGGVTPHANAGYLFFSDRNLNDAFLATAGLDADLVPWATVSLSVIGQLQAGASAYRLPGAVNGRPIANVPEIRDDALSASFGAKFDLRGARVVANVLAPYTRGGPRPDLAYTFGVERTF